MYSFRIRKKCIWNQVVGSEQGKAAIYLVYFSLLQYSSKHTLICLVFLINKFVVEEENFNLECIKQNFCSESSKYFQQIDFNNMYLTW